MTEDSTPLFKRAPRTEQDVVCLFGALLRYFDRNFIVERVQGPFPVCTLLQGDEQRKLAVEFELYASNFIAYRHPIDECDVIVCWKDDYGGWPDDIDIWELSSVVEQQCPWIIEDINDVDPAAVWDEQRFLQQAKEDGVSEQELALMTSLIHHVKDAKIGLQWLSGPTGAFAVGTKWQFFKVYSNGQLVIPFSRLGGPELFPTLVKRLNTALGTELLSEDDLRTKGKGGPLSSLFSTEESLGEFLDVWKWYAAERPDD